MRVACDPRIRRYRKLALDWRPFNGAVKVLSRKRQRLTELRSCCHRVAQLGVHARGSLLLEGVEGGRLSDAVLADDHIGRDTRRANGAAEPLVRHIALDHHHAGDKRRRRREDQPLCNRRSRARAQLSQRDAANAQPMKGAVRSGRAATRRERHARILTTGRRSRNHPNG